LRSPHGCAVWMSTRTVRPPLQQRAWLGTMAPSLDPEEDRVKEELRRLCILGSAQHVCDLLDAITPEQVRGPIDMDGNTALHLAAKGGHLKLTQVLIQRKLQVNFQNAQKLTALHVACMEDSADVVLELIFGKADVNLTDQAQQTALHKVVYADNQEVMKVLVEHGNAQLSAVDDRGTTPLLLAAEFGKMRFVEYLLAKDPSLALASDENGWTALHLCAHGREMRRNSTKPGKFTTCAKLCIEAKAPVDAFDEDRKTPLHRASQTGDRETVELLLQHGASVGAEDNCRWTPLHYASQDGHLVVAKILLEAKAEVQRQNPSCLTPLAVATMENQIKLAELLMKFGADQGLRAKGLASPIMIARKDPNKYADLLALFELGFINHEN